MRINKITAKENEDTNNHIHQYKNDEIKNNKIKKLLNEDDFLVNLVTKISKDDVKALFLEYDIDLTDSDTEQIEKSIAYSVVNNNELTVDYLEKISSGGDWKETYWGTLLLSQFGSPVMCNGRLKWEANPIKIGEAIAVAFGGVFMVQHRKGILSIAAETKGVD